MKCRNCGTDIADKALICYRCGTATTAPKIAPPAPRKARGVLPLITVLVLIVAAAGFLVPTLPPESQIIGWGVAVLLAVLAIWRLRPVARERITRRN
jgi:hypothetical protein